jgi:hypothetical protein
MYTSQFSSIECYHVEEIQSGFQNLWKSQCCYQAGQLKMRIWLGAKPALVPWNCGGSTTLFSVSWQL